MFTTGNQVVVWLSDAGARQFLGLERSDEQRSRWAYIGKVTDNPTTLGLWLTIERIEEREIGTEAKVKKTWSVTPQNCLIRIDFIVAAQHFKAYPKETVEFKETIMA